MFETGLDLAFLVIAVLAALDYGLRFSWKQPSLERSATKTTATVALLIWAAAQGVPDFILVGLAFAAIGDFAISRAGTLWLTRSAVAFLVSQMCYMIAYSDFPLSFDVAIGPILLLGFSTTVAAYAIYGVSIVAAPMAGLLHFLVLLTQFAVTQLFADASVLLAYAGIMFLISGHLLAAELALLENDASERRYTSPLVYSTYFAAQICVVLAFAPIALN